jgi:hypothetical protein
MCKNMINHMKEKNKRNNIVISIRKIRISRTILIMCKFVCCHSIELIAR